MFFSNSTMPQLIVCQTIIIFGTYLVYRAFKKNAPIKNIFFGTFLGAFIYCVVVSLMLGDFTLDVENIRVGFLFSSAYAASCSLAAYIAKKL